MPQNIKGVELGSIMMQSGESWEFVPRMEITEDDKRNYYCALALVGHKGDPNGEHTNWCLPYLRFNGVEEYTKAPLSYYEVKVHING